MSGTKNDGEFESGIKKLKNLVFWSFKWQNQKMSSKFSVFFSSRAVKINTHGENFIDRCTLTEWESLQVSASCVSMRAQERNKNLPGFQHW